MFSELLKEPREIVAILDREGRFVHLNWYWDREWGYVISDIGGLYWWELLEMDSRVLVKETFDVAWVEPREIIVKARIYSKKGVLFELEWYMHRVGDFMLLSAEYLDGKLKDEQYRLLTEHSTDMISKHDPQGVYLFVSSACERMLGYTAEELVGTSAYDYFHPDDLKAIEKSHSKVMETKDVPLVQYRILKKDGSFGWFETTSKSIRNKEGEIMELVAVTRDISDRKEAEREMKRVDERFKLIFEHSSIGIALVSTKGEWMDVNPAICKILGYSKDELLDMTFQEITHEDDLNDDLDLVKKVLHGEIPSYEMEKRYIRKDGHVVFALLSVSLVRDEDGGPMYFISQIQDISSRTEVEDKVRQQLDEMERMNQLMVGRELRMVELKEEIKSLREQLS